MENENLTPAAETDEILIPPEQDTPIPAQQTPETAAEEEVTEPEAEANTDPEGDAQENEDTENLPHAQPRTFRRVLRFLVFVLGLALCILILLCCAMSPLRRLLTQYESVQPQYVENEVYNMLFADPDWDLLYDLAGVESTAFEGKDAFIQYMQSKTAGKELTCQQTSDGLSGDRRYLLSVDDELLAAFTLTETEDSTLYANWTLKDVDVYFSRTESVTILTSPDYTVYINGVALDDSYITKNTQTVAESYLPEGLHGYRSREYQVSGVLCTPQIVVTDRNFNNQTVYYSAEADVYSTEITTSDPMTDGEYATILEAAQTQALFAVRACNISRLRQHFDPNSQIYSDLSEAEPFCESYKFHEFDEGSVSITDFYRYSDDLFSVRVSLSMDVTTQKDVTSTYQLDTTYIFALSNSGSYLVSSSTDEDLTKQLTQIKLTYMADGEVLLSEMVDADATQFTAPEYANPEGTAPTAWGKLELDGTLTVVLAAADDGSFRLAEGQTLEPTTLYPIYSEAVAAE